MRFLKFCGALFPNKKAESKHDFYDINYKIADKLGKAKDKFFDINTNSKSAAERFPVPKMATKHCHEIPTPEVTYINIKLYHHRLSLTERVKSYEDIFIADPLIPMSYSYSLKAI
jgi:hypothetical protein